MPRNRTHMVRANREMGDSWGKVPVDIWTHIYHYLNLGSLRTVQLLCTRICDGVVAFIEPRKMQLIDNEMNGSLTLLTLQLPYLHPGKENEYDHVMNVQSDGLEIQPYTAFSKQAVDELCDVINPPEPVYNILIMSRCWHLSETTSLLKELNNQQLRNIYRRAAECYSVEAQGWLIPRRSLKKGMHISFDVNGKSLCGICDDVVFNKPGKNGGPKVMIKIKEWFTGKRHEHMQRIGVDCDHLLSVNKQWVEILTIAGDGTMGTNFSVTCMLVP
eukprot:gene24357-199_t